MVSACSSDERDTGRIIAMNQCHNFRDLGGYPAQDGRRVAWRRLFRSASMDRMSTADRSSLDTYGIRSVHDLRSNVERDLRSMAFVETLGIAYVTRDYAGSHGHLVRAAERAVELRLDMRETMIEAYRRLPYEQAPAYSRLFRALAAGALPLVFNCAAGKDRTGIAAALILEALGVARPVILADYMLTEQFYEALRETLMVRPENSALDTIDPQVWSPMVRSDPAYLDAMFETIEQRQGSVAGYLARVLGLSDDDLDGMRAQLLVPADAPDPR